MKAWIPKDPVDEWIASVVPDHTFSDIGGIGVDSVNERITFAIKYGAKSATMIDIRPSDYYEWDVFRGICAKKGISNYREIASIDINDTKLNEKVGSYHVVNCTGILYHLPSPLFAFDNLKTVVEKYLIINTVIIPERVQNKFGSLTFSEGTAVFLPGISEFERSILREHYQSKLGLCIDEFAPRLSEQKEAEMPWRKEDKFSCWPYWWLFTNSSFRSLVHLMGFKILKEWEWKSHALHIFAEKVHS